MHHNLVHDLLRQGLYVDSWFGLLEDVAFFANEVYGCEWGMAISAEGEDSRLRNIRIYDNLLYDNRASGVFFGVWGHDELRSDIAIYNNTIVGNGSPGHWAGPTGGIDLRSRSVQDVSIFNNIVTDNWAFEIGTFDDPADGLDLLEDRNVWIYHNLTGRFRNRPDEPGAYGPIYGLLGERPFEGDPLFVDRRKADFRLAPGSPAIGAGFSAHGATVDLGAVPHGVDFGVRR